VRTIHEHSKGTKCSWNTQIEFNFFSFHFIIKAIMKWKEKIDWVLFEY
jgi:hypothetical protein